MNTNDRTLHRIVTLPSDCWREERGEFFANFLVYGNMQGESQEKSTVLLHGLRRLDPKPRDEVKLEFIRFQGKEDLYPTTAQMRFDIRDEILFSGWQGFALESLGAIMLVPSMLVEVNLCCNKRPGKPVQIEPIFGEELSSSSVVDWYLKLHKKV